MQPRFSLKPGLPPPSASHAQPGALIHNSSPCIYGRPLSPARASRVAVIPAPQPQTRASSTDSRHRHSVAQSPPSTSGRTLVASEASAPPLAVVGVDTTNDCKPNFLYIGADRDRDGIPDALQSTPARSSSPPRKLRASPNASARDIEITTAETIETRLKEFFEQQKAKIGELARASLAVHIEEFSRRVAMAEERWARNLDEERRIREESLKALRMCIEQNQAALLQTAAEEKNLVEMLHIDLNALQSRHSSVLAELSKTRSDCSYAVGAQSTLQEFVASVLMRFEALREKTEAVLADVQEQAASKTRALEVEVDTLLHSGLRAAPALKSTALNEDGCGDACLSLEEAQAVDAALQKNIEALREESEVLHENDDLRPQMGKEHQELTALRQDLHIVKAGLRASSRGSTGASGSEADSAMEKIDDVLGMIGSLCDRIGQLEQTWSQALLEFQAERESREQAATAAEERETAAIAAEERLRRLVQEEDRTLDVRPGFSRVRAVVSEIEGQDMRSQRKRLVREAITPVSRGRSKESPRASSSEPKSSPQSR